eukprot:TRINITY_DN13896_c0_g3_i2.p2 TRINITY_DN13896_c0_g3~~TRINITY_DN13896_c0_g3_i2.p2  ORF type:complete len:129 (+),score=35.59 TRINITY_DN13896_c0_g3_i2:861-1247(+)
MTLFDNVRTFDFSSDDRIPIRVGSSLKGESESMLVTLQGLGKGVDVEGVKVDCERDDVEVAAVSNDSIHTVMTHGKRVRQEAGSSGDTQRCVLIYDSEKHEFTLESLSYVAQVEPKKRKRSPDEDITG